jgi:hypothetical protein
MTMAVIHTPFWLALFQQQINLETDEVRVMLTRGYEADSQHGAYSDVAQFEIEGTGYTLGGNLVDCLIAETEDQVNAVFAATTWPTSTISADGATYYVGARLVMSLVFGQVVTSTAGAFSIGQSTVRLNNA